MAGHRHPARDSAPVGGPAGLHLPGILPEPGVVEGGVGDHDRLVLEDLAEALPPEDREEGLGEPGEAEPLEAQRPRARLPWWYAAAFLGAAGVGLLGSALLLGPGRPVPGLALGVAGGLLCLGAARSAAGRGRAF